MPRRCPARCQRSSPEECLSKNSTFCQGRPGGQGGLLASRRGFLKLSGAAAVAAQLDLLDYASSLFAADSAPTGKPRVAVVYFRREEGGGDDSSAR